MVKRIKIGNVELENNIFLAPLAGYTDVGFRSICKFFGAGLTFTEMVSAKALLHDSEKTMELLYREKNEVPCAVQLFGKVPEDFVRCINHKILKDFEIIDINMGCPAPKIVKNGEGSALLKNIGLAEKIITASVNSTSRPVTVKFRIGYDNDNIIAEEFAKMCEMSGAAAITIHGRTKSQMYSGKADWDIIEHCAKLVKIPVFANGDILTKEDFEYLTSEGKHIAGVMIGRGALGNPQIFADIQDKKSNYNKLEVIKKHIELYRKYYSEKYVLLNMRKHLCFYLKNERNSSETRAKIVRLESLEEVIKLLEDFFV